MERLLWRADGERRVPSAAAFDREARKLRAGALERLCEFNPHGPIYFIPTRLFLRALAREIRALGARRVLEVAAGDGFLARELQRIEPDLEVIATDSGKWERPQARMNARERREFAGVQVAGLRPGPGVVRLDAIEAIRKYKPHLVLASWLPPGPLLSRILRERLGYVLEIGAGSGITGDIRCWRFDHEFLDEVEQLGRCRLDARGKLHTRVTLYISPNHEISWPARARRSSRR